MTSPGSGTAWIDVVEAVRVRQSLEFSMNSALLLDREHAIVVDPGVLPSEIDDIAAAVTAAAPQQVTVFLTHGHWDHVLGLPWWPDAEVIAHDRLAEEVQADQPRILEEASRAAREHGETWERGFRPFRPRHAVSGLHYTHRGPWHLVFRDAPGHSGSQLSLHVPDRRLLFAADMLSDIEIPALDTAPERYRTTLETLRPLAEHGAIETLVPGHGAVARGQTAVLERLERDLGYLAELDRRAHEAVARGMSDEAADREITMDLSAWGGGDYNAGVHTENVRLAMAARRRR